MKATPSFLLLASPLVLIVPACGDDSATGGGGSGNGTNVGASDEGGGGAAPSCELDRLRLEGTWALRVTVPVGVSNTEGGAFAMCPASQQGEATVILAMAVTELAGIHSGRLALCAIDLPPVAAAPETCGTDDVELDVVGFRDRVYFNETNPTSIQISGDEPGATFTIPSFSFDYGVDPPLRAWDTADPLCDDPLLGHGGTCEDACIIGGCDDLDYWNDDFPGFTFGICGVGAGQSFDDCNLSDPASTEEFTTIQGPVFTTMSVTTGEITGAFATSCEGTGDMELDVAMEVIGGNLWVQGAQQNVTALAHAMPRFNFPAGASAVHVARVDGRHGSPNLADSDLDDTCRNLAQNPTGF